jgi:fucose permease
VLSGFWVALITARMLLGRVLLHVSALALVPLMAGGAALSLALATLAPGFAAASALLLVAAFALAGVTPTVLGVAATALPARTGTVFGLLFSFSVTGAMTVPWAAGHLAEAHDVRIVLDIGASGFAVVTLLALRARHLGRAG